MIELPRETIDAEAVRLRLPREADADEIAAACADPSSQRFLHQLPSPYTRTDALWWITNGAPAARAAGGAAFVIADAATDHVVGGVGINRVVGERHQGEVGYWVAPWARGRGVARTATLALTEWAFRQGFARLELHTEPENTASQRVALAAGYRYEGLRRSAGVGRAGSRHDLIAWTRLPDDPPGPTPRVLPDLPGGALTDGVVTLRPLRTDDTDDVYALRRLPESVATSVPPVLPDRAEVVDRCARAESKWLAGERADLTIRDAASGAFAGQIGLYYGEPRTQQAIIGYALAPQWRGRGYATRAARLLTEWVFKNTDIARVIAGTLLANVASQRVLERAGFVREGLQRGRLPGADGSRVDDVLYALLPEDLDRG